MDGCMGGMCLGALVGHGAMSIIISIIIVLSSPSSPWMSSGMLRGMSHGVGAVWLGNLEGLTAVLWLGLLVLVLMHGLLWLGAGVLLTRGSHMWLVRQVGRSLAKSTSGAQMPHTWHINGNMGKYGQQQLSEETLVHGDEEGCYCGLLLVGNLWHQVQGRLLVGMSLAKPTSGAQMPHTWHIYGNMGKQGQQQLCEVTLVHGDEEGCYCWLVTCGIRYKGGCWCGGP